MENNNPFKLAERPKSSSELLTWFFFEPNRFKTFVRTLTQKNAIIFFLKVYSQSIIIIIILSSLFYLLSALNIIWLELPSHYPKAFKPEFILKWISDGAFSLNLQIYIKFTFECNLFESIITNYKYSTF